VIAAAALLAALAAADAAIADELTRLEGHRVTVADDGSGYVIEDVAGEGPPLVGVVKRRGAELVLVTEAAAWRLVGPLAVPRIAGPDYKVWVLGDFEGDALRPRRLGVLAPPRPPLTPPRAAGSP
jgi:hypothetical protein